jgi:hypothetical protein
MKIQIELPFSAEELEPALEAAAQGNNGPLRALCQKEVERFDATARRNPDYSDGLVRMERLAVEGYLYQKLRGHIDEEDSQGDLPQGGHDGAA